MTSGVRTGAIKLAAGRHPDLFEKVGERKGYFRCAPLA